MHSSLARSAGTIDVDYAMGDMERARVIGLEARCQFLALDAGDAVAVAADLVAARAVVGNALEYRRRRREGVTDEQVGLDKQLRSQIERVSADVETILLHYLLQVINGEGAFSLVDGMQNGIALPRLSEAVSQHIEAKAFVHLFLKGHLVAHTATKLVLFWLIN